MKRAPRLTQPSLRILKLFIDDPSPRAGSDVMGALGLASGTLYPIVARFVKCGWLTGKWEAGPPQRLGRPRRRYYTLTQAGRQGAREALAELSTP